MGWSLAMVLPGETEGKDVEAAVSHPWSPVTMSGRSMVVGVWCLEMPEQSTTGRAGDVEGGVDHEFTSPMPEPGEVTGFVRSGTLRRH